LREIQKFGKPHSELYWIILSNKSYFGGLGGGAMKIRHLGILGGAKTMIVTSSMRPIVV